MGNLHSQEVTFCTNYLDENFIGPLPPLGNKEEKNYKHSLRLYIHILQDDNGNGGISYKDVQVALSRLDQVYNPLGIYFVREECDVDYIRNTTFLDEIPNRETQCDILSAINPTTGFPYEHTDGIDIYFGSSNSYPTNGGSAQGIPSSHLFVWGLWDTNVAPTVTAKSNVIVHEMGHCLGLFHTFYVTISQPGATSTNCAGEVVSDPNQCKEWVMPYNNNGATCGDYVEDTPADPGLNHNVNTDCVWTPAFGQELDDAFGNTYTPDVHNYMAYTNIECMNHFSDGQVERMHRIMDLSQILTDCKIIPDFTYRTVSGNEIWTVNNTPHNGDFIIEDGLIIENGASLTIEQGVKVRFGLNAEVYVHKNAQLTLRGTLSSKGCFSTWEGVKLESNELTPQGLSIHGTFTGNGGTIENAGTAINAQHGGVVKCTEMTFKNNSKGVVFFDFQNYLGLTLSDDPSFFQNCSFINDDDNHINTFHSFIRLEGVSGVKISGCDFTNSQVIDGTEIDDWGYGILAFDSKFTVESVCIGNTYPCNTFKPCTFTGLGEGVSMKTIIIQKPCSVQEAVFTDCFIGLRNKAVNASTFLFNEFHLGNLPSTNFETRQLGIHFDGVLTDINCQENSFIGDGANSAVQKIGIYSFSTGESNKSIRKNTFNNMSTGILVAGKNGTPAGQSDPVYGSRGLSYLCNENINASLQGYDIKLEPDGYLREDQGYPEIDNTQQVLNYRSAGNKFSHTGVDILRDGIGTSAPPFNYYYYIGSISENPMVNGSVNKSSAPQNLCPTEYCAPPCYLDAALNIIKQEYFVDNASMKNLLVNIATLSPFEKEQLAYYQYKMSKDVNKIIIHTLYDTINFDKDTLLAWVDRSNTIGGELWKMENLVGEMNYSGAHSVLSAITQKFILSSEQQADISNLDAIVTILDNKVVYALDNATVLNLKNYEFITGNAEVWVQNILTKYGYYYPPKYIDGGKPKNGLPKPSEYPSSHESETSISFEPNPASAYVNFHLNKDAPESRQLLILNLQGTVVKKMKAGTNSSLRWNTDNNPSGIYFFQLISKGALIQSGKIIIEK